MYLGPGGGVKEASGAVRACGEHEAAVARERQRLCARIPLQRKAVDALEGAHVPQRQLPAWRPCARHSSLWHTTFCVPDSIIQPGLARILQSALLLPPGKAGGNFASSTVSAAWLAQKQHGMASSNDVQAGRGNLLWEWGLEEAQAMVGSVGLQATSQTSGNRGSSRMCAIMRLVSTCHAFIPLPTVPTSLQQPSGHACCHAG